MKSVKYILDEKWQILLRKAKADLNAATILYRENGISKEVVMFHLEQAVEKLIKAVLDKNNINYAEIENLFELIKLSQERFDFDNEQLNLLGELNEYRFEEYSENFGINDVDDINEYFNFVNEVEKKVLEIL
jgi:HEPN domain-containing protein